MKTVVVLSANEGTLGSFQDPSSSGADALVCSSPKNSQDCVVVSEVSDVHLQILGYTLTLPPIWLGGDSQDNYTSNADWTFDFNDLASELEVVVRVKRRHGFADKRLSGLQADSGVDGLHGPQTPDGSRTDNTSGPDSTLGSDGASGTGGSQNTTASQGEGQLIEFEVLKPPSSLGMLTQSIYPYVSSDKNPLAMLSPMAPVPTPTALVQTPAAGWETPSTSLGPSFSDTGPRILTTLVSGSEGGSVVPSVPEASTWTMTLAGFAALGLFKRPRIAAALRCVKG